MAAQTMKAKGLMTLDEQIAKLVDERVEAKLDERIPEIIRALAVREVEPEHRSYVDALEIAKLLGRDVSTPKSIHKAKRHVYDLARRKLIPSIRISDRNVKFDLAEVKVALQTKVTRNGSN
jgi:hypothetical protein